MKRPLLAAFPASADCLSSDVRSGLAHCDQLACKHLTPHSQPGTVQKLAQQSQDFHDRCPRSDDFFNFVSVIPYSDVTMAPTSYQRIVGCRQIPSC